MRIQIDYEKRELYIKQYKIKKRFKFNDIKHIEIIEYNEVAFDIEIVTDGYTRRMAYFRYYRRRPNKKIESILSELKNELKELSNE